MWIPKEEEPKSILRRIIEQKEVNLILTGAYGLLMIYCMLVALFYRNVRYPLTSVIPRVSQNGSSEFLLHIVNVGREMDGGGEDSMSLLTDYDTGRGDDSGDRTIPRSRPNISSTYVPDGSNLLAQRLKPKSGCGDNAKVGDFPTNGRGVTWLGDADDSIELLVQTIISLFLLWTLALVFGRFAAYLYLPPLFGMVFAGVLFANVTFLRGILEIHQKWADVTRQVAFILCLIRCGLGVNFNALKISWRRSAALAVMSAIGEVSAVVLLVTLAFGIPFEIALIFALVLGSNSPPLTIPQMVSLEQRGYGRNVVGGRTAIPALVTNAVAIDNTFCVMTFIAVSTLVFRQVIQDPISVVARIISDLIIGIGVGIFAGLLMHILPCQRAHLSHFTRATLMFTTSCAFLFGSLALHRKIFGPVAVLALSITASVCWRKDNRRAIRREAQAMKTIWELLIQPLTFALIGILIDFSAMNRRLLLQALATMLVAVVARLLAGLFAARIVVDELTIKERIFVACSFVPKATAQAIIFPFMVGYCSIEPHTRFVALTAVLSIILTSPLCQFLSHIFGPYLLDKSVAANDGGLEESRPHINAIKHNVMRSPVSHNYQHNIHISAIDNGIKFGKFEQS